MQLGGSIVLCKSRREHLHGESMPAEAGQSHTAGRPRGKVPGVDLQRTAKVARGVLELTKCRHAPSAKMTSGSVALVRFQERFADACGDARLTPCERGHGELKSLLARRHYCAR